jgi:hypothetical protein
MMPEVVETIYKRRTPLKRSKRPLGASSAKKTRKVSSRKKKTKADLWREFGFERPAKPRFSGLRGIVWHVLSLYVRQRDLKAFGPVCVNCGEEKTDFHGGHFIAAGQCGWDGLALDPENIHAECSSCNLRDKAKLKYAYHLDLRYGPGTAQKLRDRYNHYRFSGDSFKNFSNVEYRRLITHYKQAVENSQKEEIS